MAATVAPINPQHPAGFLLNTHHQQPPAYPDPAPSVQPTVPVAPKPQPSDPYYGHEETAKICARFIKHVFNCPSEPTTATHAPNSKPTETTISLPRFIAYAFHRTRLHISVAYHALFLLSRLKSRYPAASCAYGHRLFLTSYMLSSKVVCDDTYSNKSWAIVGQGFYELRDVNLMEREMIHYLSFDLTISSADLEKFTQHVKSTYRRGLPRTPYVVIPDKSRENDHFGKGTLEIETRPLATTTKRTNTLEPTTHIPAITVAVPVPITVTVPISPDDEDSPIVDSASSNSSRTSSPPSPCLKTPPDEATNIAGVHKGSKGFRGPIGEVRIAREPIAIRYGMDSNYASPSGW